MSAAFTADAVRLMKQLDRLPDRVSRKVSRRAVTFGTTPIVKEYKANVPVVEGNLQESIGKKSKLYGDTAVSIVGARIRGKFKGYHAHLIENGKINVDGSFTPGQPILRQAMDSTREQVLDRMTRKLAEGIEKEAAKL